MRTAGIKQSIRIIKRNERELFEEQSASPKSHLKTDVQSRRELIATISSWIDERRETMKSFSESKSSYSL